MGQTARERKILNQIVCNKKKIKKNSQHKSRPNIIHLWHSSIDDITAPIAIHSIMIFI